MSLRKTAFGAHADENTRVLICGSLPGERSLAERRYYAHPSNRFWQLLGAVSTAISPHGLGCDRTVSLGREDCGIRQIAHARSLDARSEITRQSAGRSPKAYATRAIALTPARVKDRARQVSAERFELIDSLIERGLRRMPFAKKLRAAVFA